MKSPGGLKPKRATATKTPASESSARESGAASCTNTVEAFAWETAAETLEKIQRYETKLKRQMFRAMNQLERLQRMRQGEAIPAPLTMEVSERA